MRLMAALALCAALGMGAAHAQETAAPAVPPSTCGAFPEPPAAPDGATATAEQVRAAVAAYEAWRAQEQPILDCRRAEADALNAQANARASEYRTRQTENVARAQAFQAQLDIAQARAGRSRR